MKTIRKTILILSVLSIISCSKKKEKAETVESNSEKQATTSEKNGALALNVDFSDKRYNDVYKHYIAIKDGLVNSDKDAVKKGSGEIGTAFANLGVEQSLMDAIAEMIRTDDIEVQREEFSALSNELTEILSKAHIKSGKIYKQYCPMAFNSEGAYWLSTEKEIRNPYFGDAMLKCGEVKAEIN
ncbi:DUF3347 domain-containing protein [Flavobacteriaceae bacterium R38]|nr:DUF3347 domain-containing protein [Flavobacteriaceae bacterium R38]